MRRRSHTILGWVSLALGLAHTGLAFTSPALTQEVLWFAGAGLAIICAALSNIFRPAGAGRASRLAVATQNMILTGFFCAAWSVLPQPQVAIGGSLFASMFVLSLLDLLQHRSARLAGC